ncbi:hypothetical protein HK405_012319, partial [Cladochytrium tenue]
AMGLSNSLVNGSAGNMASSLQGQALSAATQPNAMGHMPMNGNGANINAAMSSLMASPAVALRLQQYLQMQAQSQQAQSQQQASMSASGLSSSPSPAPPSIPLSPNTAPGVPAAAGPAGGVVSHSPLFLQQLMKNGVGLAGGAGQALPIRAGNAVVGTGGHGGGSGVGGDLADSVEQPPPINGVSG